MPPDRVTAAFLSPGPGQGCCDTSVIPLVRIAYQVTESQGTYILTDNHVVQNALCAPDARIRASDILTLIDLVAPWIP